MSEMQRYEYIIIAERGKQRATRSLSQLAMGQDSNSRATLRRMSQLATAQSSMEELRQQRSNEITMRRLSLRISRPPDIESLQAAMQPPKDDDDDDDVAWKYLLMKLLAWKQAIAGAGTQIKADCSSWRKDNDRKKKVISSFDNFDAVSLIFSLCAPRAVTLMIFPALTPLSVYAVNSVSTPLLLLCNEARNFFPPLFLSNAFELAANDEMQRNYATSSAQDRGVYFTVMINALVFSIARCRAVNIMANLFKFGMVFGLMYGDVKAWLIASFIVLMPLQFVESLTIYELVMRRSGIIDEDLEQFKYFRRIYKWADPEYASALEKRRKRRKKKEKKKRRKTMAKVQPEELLPQEDKEAKDDKIVDVPSTVDDSDVSSRGKMMRIYGNVLSSISRLRSTREVHPEAPTAQGDSNTGKASVEEEEGDDDKEKALYFRQRLESRGNALDNELDIQRLQAHSRLQERLKAKKTNSFSADVKTMAGQLGHDDANIVVSNVDGQNIDGGDIYGDKKVEKLSALASPPAVEDTLTTSTVVMENREKSVSWLPRFNFDFGFRSLFKAPKVADSRVEEVNEVCKIDEVEEGKKIEDDIDEASSSLKTPAPEPIKDPKKKALYVRQRLESKANALDNELDIKKLQAQDRLKARLKDKISQKALSGEERGQDHSYDHDSGERHW